MARQLATMINAGLSLLRSLTILAEQTESKPLAKRPGTGPQRRRERGVAFSASLAKHADVFPPLMINMVRAGEVGGFLDQVLLSVAENFEAEVKLRGKVKSAMTYPVVVFVIAILAVVGMLLFIVPVFAGMFASLGGELPAAHADPGDAVRAAEVGVASARGRRSSASASGGHGTRTTVRCASGSTRSS